MLNVAVVLGTRPEAVKLAPVAARLNHAPWLNLAVIDTGQQPDLFHYAAAAVGLEVGHTLKAHRPGQNLGELAAAIQTELTRHFTLHRPDLVLVQGDTQSAAAAAMAAALLRIPVAHVEAGLRSGNLAAPFPEELNRRQIAQAATLHFAPTWAARDNLKREGIPDTHILVTGNPVIDSLCSYRSPLTSQKPTARVLFTCHRRESWGAPLAGICDAVLTIAGRHPYLSWDVILPAAPDARRMMHDKLGSHPHFTLLDGVPYPAFVRMMHQARLIMTDSGGITEEAATLGAPTLVLRNELDRPEALDLTNVRLAGVNSQAIVDMADAMLRQPFFRRDPCRGPFGDGRAAARIVTAIDRWRQGIGPFLTEDEMFYPPDLRPLPHHLPLHSLASHG